MSTITMYWYFMVVTEFIFLLYVAVERKVWLYFKQNIAPSLYKSRCSNKGLEKLALEVGK